MKMVDILLVELQSQPKVKAKERSYRAKNAALAYRIWCFCQTERWNTSAALIAEELGVEKNTVSLIMSNRDWTRRLAYTADDYRSEAAKKRDRQANFEDANYMIQHEVASSQPHRKRSGIDDVE